MTKEERAKEYYPKGIEVFTPEGAELLQKAYIKGATEQKEVDKEYYKELINMLIDELQTSRAYHLGITGLDSDAEIARKERDGDTALIRGIDRTIKYVRKAMEE